MIDFIKQQLENEFLSGGAVLIILGAIMAFLRHIPAKIIAFLHRRVITTVDVADQDSAFYWLQEWLAQHPYSERSRLLSVTTEKHLVSNSNKKKVWKPAEEESEEGTPMVEETEEGMPVAEETAQSHLKILFTPAPGAHLLRFEGHWVMLSRIREKAEGSNDGRFWREQFVLKTLVRDRQFLRRLILEARAIANPPKERHISVLTNTYGNWSLVGTRMPRGFDSVILENDAVSKILARTKEFFSGAEWYQQRGIPYQMGFLFYGLPGNGKTSTAIALASRFNRDVYLAKVDTITDTMFRQVMSSLPQHSILLIEDIDCFFRDRGKLDSSYGSDPILSLSGFLNAIDGVMGTEGRLLILTTNHLDKLDSAMIRPGRVDHKIEFRNASQDQAKRLFIRFFPNDYHLAQSFADGVGGQYSMADLQKVLLDNRNNPADAVSALACEVDMGTSNTDRAFRTQDVDMASRRVKIDAPS